MLANLVPSILKGSKVVQSFVIKNSGPILTTVGVASLMAATVSAYKAAVKVKIEKEKAEAKIAIAEDEETIKSIKRAAAIKVAKILVPSIIFTLICGGCIIGNNYIHLRKQATLAAAYAGLEQTLKDYDESLEPVVGKKKAEAVREEVVHKDVERRGGTDPSCVWDTGKGTTLFFDSKSGQYIRSSHDAVRLAFSELNNKLNNYKVRKDEILLRDIYEGLNMPQGVIRSDLAAAYGYSQGESIGCNLNQTGTSAWDEPFVYINYHVHLLDADTSL